MIEFLILAILLLLASYISISISMYCTCAIVCYALKGIRPALQPRSRNLIDDEVKNIRKFQSIQCLAWPTLLYYTLKKLDEKEV